MSGSHSTRWRLLMACGRQVEPPNGPITSHCCTSNGPELVEGLIDKFRLRETPDIASCGAYHSRRLFQYRGRLRPAPALRPALHWQHDRPSPTPRRSLVRPTLPDNFARSAGRAPPNRNLCRIPSCTPPRSPTQTLVAGQKGGLDSRGYGMPQGSRSVPALTLLRFCGNRYRPPSPASRKAVLNVAPACSPHRRYAHRICSG
jgi:hypothetical protein